MIRTIIELWILTGLLSLIYLYETSDDLSYFDGKNRPIQILLSSVICAPLVLGAVLYQYLWMNKRGGSKKK